MLLTVSGELTEEMRTVINGWQNPVFTMPEQVSNVALTFGLWLVYQLSVGGLHCCIWFTTILSDKQCLSWKYRPAYVSSFTMQAANNSENLQCTNRE